MLIVSNQSHPVRIHAVYASITTLRLNPAQRGPKRIVPLLRDFVRANRDVARAAGMLDAFLLHLPPEHLVAITCYATRAEVDAAEAVVRSQLGSTGLNAEFQLEHRVAGVVIDAVLPTRTDLTWRTHARSMFATLTTWRVGPALRSDAALEAYVSEGYRRFGSTLVQLGFGDGMVIRPAPDEMAVLHLYADRVSEEDAYRDAMADVEDFTAVQVQPIETRSGQAYDLAMLARAR
jgi:hypothetical protein